MDPILKLEAIEGIKLAKARYFRGIDTKDNALLRRALMEDIEFDCRGVATDPVTGINIAPATEDVIRGRDRIAEVADVTLRDVLSVHHASAPEIEITGVDTGSAVWPMVDRLLFPAGSPFKELIGYGHYHDTYERDGEEWRIKTMRLTRTRVDFVRW